MTDDEKHQVKAIVKGYFDSNGDAARVSLVKHSTGRNLKRIEILGPYKRHADGTGK